VELDVLAGGDVGVGVAEHRVRLRPPGELVGELADGPGLRGVQAPARDLDAQHEGVAALALRVQPHPLEPLGLARHGGDRPWAFGGVALDDRVTHVERVAFQLPLLDLVELTLTEKLHARPSKYGVVCAPDGRPAGFAARRSASGTTGRYVARGDRRARGHAQQTTRPWSSARLRVSIGRAVMSGQSAQRHALVSTP
jgi:hypothetical protein